MSVIQRNILILLIFSFSLAIIYFFNPLEYNFYPKCLFSTLTGYKCAGCGSLRAIYSILHGNLIEGLKYNFLLITASPFLLLEMFSKNHKLQKYSLFNSRVKIIIWFIAALLFSVGRNIY